MADANPVELDIPPGLVLTLSELGERGRWNRCDHIRFVHSKPQKIGGWVDRCPGQAMVGIAHGAMAWVTAARQDLVMTGTSTKLYAIDDAIHDITPLRVTAASLGVDPFSVTAGLTLVTVTDVAHGAQEGATVIFHGATAGGGITINGTYIIQTIISPDRYTIIHSASALVTDTTTGGAGVTVDYEINPGPSSQSYGAGWGAGGWGEEGWGTARTTGTPILSDMRVWSFDSFGNELLVGYTEGQIYLWDEPAAADRAAVIANSPVCRYTFLTAERFIFALGTTTRMTIQWPDRFDITIWTPADNVEASERTLQDGNQLMAGCLFNDSINLIWSDTAIYRAQYIPGATFFYDIAVIGTECGLVSQDSFDTTPIGVLWMSPNDFFLYNGQVTVVPNRDDVRRWVFAHMQQDQAAKVWCGYNPRFNEVWWGWPMRGSSECDYYVKVSLDGFFWDVGTIARSAMAAQRTSVGDLVMMGTDSRVYTHEAGHDANGAILESYIGHAAFSPTDSDTDVDIMAYQPDFEWQTGDIEYQIETVDRPMDTAILETDTQTIEEGQGVVDLYLGGRYLRALIRSNVMGGDFRLGIGHLDIAIAGEE